MDHFLAGYKRHNPNTDEAALAAIRSDMMHLIEVKLKMFPYDLRQIVMRDTFIPYKATVSRWCRRDCRGESMSKANRRESLVG